MSKLTTDDEVLALAEKIKRQRYTDAVYEKASKELRRLEQNIDSHSTALRGGANVSFGTVSDTGYYDSVKIALPEKGADELLTLIQDYIAEKEG